MSADLKQAEESARDVRTLLEKSISSSYAEGKRTSKIQQLISKYTGEDQAGKRDPRTSICRPWSYEDYLLRVSTFKTLPAWFAKPAIISPLECAAFGWKCDAGRDTLVCSCCNAKLIHDGVGDANGYVLRSQLTTGHLPECGWRTEEVKCNPRFRDIPGLAESERAVSRHALRRAIWTLGALAQAADAGHVAPDAVAIVTCGEAVELRVQDWSVPEAAAALRSLQAAEKLLASGVSLAYRRHSVEANGDEARRLLFEMAHFSESLLDRTQLPTATPTGAEEAALAPPPSCFLTPLIRTALALGLYGWQLREVFDGPRAVQAHPSGVGRGDGAGSGAAPAVRCELWCQLCSRTLPFPPRSRCPDSSSPAAAAPAEIHESLLVDCRRAHRHFCPFVNPPAESPPWLVERQHAPVQGQQDMDGAHQSVLAFSLLAGQQRSAGAKGDRNADRECSGDLSPEQSYKKIRSFLCQI